MGYAPLLMLLLVTQLTRAPHPLANPVECQASQYLDEHGQCAPCRACGPGLELSKECGYSEGGDSQCLPCRPRRFKDSWGHQGCKPCLSCSLINRIQKAPCTATSNTACGGCFPGFYSKTQIGGLQDLECVPCTKQTPPSEPQCLSRISQKVENPARPPLDSSPLVVLTSGALVIVVLVSFLSLLYCQQFWKHQCQRVFLRRRDFSTQSVTFQASPGPEQLLDPCCLGIKRLSPAQEPLEGPAAAAQFFSEGEVLRFHLPSQQANWDFSKLITAGPKALQAGSPREPRPLLRNSGCSDCSTRASSFTELQPDSARDTDDPEPLSSCATEMQHQWPHAPVECTELDLRNFSAQAKQLHREDAKERDVRVSLRGGTEPVPASCVGQASQARLTSGSPHSSCSSFRNPVAECGEQLCDDGRG
ncbi:tumor necrosis factor receptor superfamily member 27-like [Sphaerodactylus townsendi]|uniref:tumor necrosis factor receptor superfamily member 27-like n=1 Tax=Sphaerodactylus townsendi TaxID=933632 RepID=UPI0020275BBD|nr:tumor necrosis factor receptor superfamily member 27-like [Sphaerodactylus townsendi]XP_048338856.1 tumor necrosis factor receptor superfamily member 27-like [Sphaerodactylus townsendi]XP_048338857.1 tumor necrosis factor receptor superfamily member 27-like [Sphaerodactylus townsendi]XP_048338858.1 tumor necrosis factor receptor superfamily member 27-like [Sphaerodactylus townsendi]XP_048338859.1 tumor necrosis factor receptor superfamily member 27-like [Sphaerodactylus townsendi]